MNTTELKELLANATPGHWEVGCLDHAGQRIVRQQHIEICTCWHHSVGSIEKEMEANARLIAIAPQLAADNIALQASNSELIGLAEDLQAEVERLREALEEIAKRDLQAIALIALGDMKPKPEDTDQ